MVSSDLQWKCHYLSILSKSYKCLGLLRRVFSSASCVRAKRVLYLSLVQSKLLYCSPIWRPHLLTYIRALENVQRRATKFILNDFLSNYRFRLVNLNLLPLMMIFELSSSSLSVLRSQLNILIYSITLPSVLAVPDHLPISN